MRVLTKRLNQWLQKRLFNLGILHKWYIYRDISIQQEVFEVIFKLRRHGDFYDKSK